MNGNSSRMSTPQSPGTEAREKEKFQILLDINAELLYESVQLVNSRTELKREQASAESMGIKAEDVDYAEEERIAKEDYNQ